MLCLETVDNGGLHQTPSHSKGIIDEAVNRKKLLHLSPRLEAVHVTFSLAGRLMGDFSPVVGVL